MCCPHGHLFNRNQRKCIKLEGGLSYNPMLWDHKDKVFLDNKEKNILTVGPKKGTSFKCPSPSARTVFRGNFSGNFRILMNGKLEREVSSVDKTRMIQRWPSDSYCVIYTKAEYFQTKLDTSNDWYLTFQFSFMTCLGDAPAPSSCEMLTSTFHIICFSISTSFLIVTLLVYVFDDSLRKTNPLFSKITLGFISNLIICFIVLISNTLQSLENGNKGTLPCILSGYILQYFYLGIFFWISGMSFNIWLKFTQMSMQPPSNEEENKKFWKYFIYAQGTPLMIVILTAIVDATAREETNHENLIHYPNMGKYLCFLGAISNTSFKQNFFGRPEFIYLYLFVAIIQLSNIVFLGHTIRSLCSGWRNQAKLLKITGK